MGFLSKQRTRARTAALQVPVGHTPDWVLDGLPRVAALIRAAVAAVGAQRLRSSAFRGHDTLSVGTSRASGDSSLWYEQHGFNKFVAALGLDSTSGIALDWSINVGIARSPDGGLIGHLTTPHVLTRDGALVNADTYEEVRDLLKGGLQELRPPRLELEMAVVETGLGVPASPMRSETPTPLDDGFVISTALSAGEVNDRLARLHFAHDPQQPGEWQVGLASIGAAATVRMEIKEAGSQHREVSFAVRLPTTGPVDRAVALRQSRRFAEFAHSLIARQDEAATLRGITEASAA